MTSEAETKKKVELRKSQRKNIPLMILSIIIATSVLTFALFDQLPWTITINNNIKTVSLENRLIFTIQLLFIDCFPLVFSIFAVIHRRVTTIALNPLDPKGQILVEQRQRILQNTLEQLIIKLILSLTLCTIIQPNELTLLPAFTILFVIGRFSFAFGYPKYRSFGFLMNLTSTIFVFILISHRLFIQGTLLQYVKCKSK
ncbi:unnamed protein product [Adineta steineri]|uniref:Uncharacterized protein n=1 Tax=Adineta steineri TaxID=433720 RepID=A0A820I8K6_9BILA|nr:unnamed protein product [Adineta steineri]